LLQRKLKIGYNRASRLMDELEEKGFVSAYDEAQKSRLVIR
jgi:S-DNA-T family DNA segregation ATPase FtsK/SpoIIIE